MPLPSAQLEKDLVRLKEKGLYRTLESVSAKGSSGLHKDLIDFSSNDYLGLARHPAVIRAASDAVVRWGAGSGASRLLAGNLKIHEDLEKDLARFKKEQSAVVFSSGYLASLGVMTALLDEKDVVILDRLNHASLVDAARLSKAKLWVYPHRDVGRLKELLRRAGGFRRRLVATDAYFSMDGDVAPLDRLSELCEKSDALLMIDEAHSTGVFGKSGRGLTEHFDLSGKIQVVMGTLSKALGSVGGFVAGSDLVRQTLVNRCRPFIYTTAPAPAASAAALESIRIIEAQPSLREHLWSSVAYLREGLLALGLDLLGSEGPIIPIRVAGTRAALTIKDRLKKERISVPAIRPPTVPKNTDRIRISVTASHTRPQLDALLKALRKVV